MESEKMLVVGIMSVILVVGLSIGVMMFTFDPNANSGNGGTTPTTPATIEKDTDLLSLQLQVPDWNVLMSDDSLLSIQSLEGKFVIVDLMATWCTACATQNYEFLELYEDFSEDELVILSLSVDFGDTISMMANYMTDKGLPWAHGLDTNGVFTNYFDVVSIPTIVVIDIDGYFRYVHSGVWPMDSTDRVTGMTEVLAGMMP
jgi:thiol-disulfide isomerase/thioredoxin